MHGQTATRPNSVWADLDALVLEEVEALRAGPPRVPEPLAFGSEEEFVARASAFLMGRENPDQLIERLRAHLHLSSAQDAAVPDTHEEQPAPEQEAPEPPVETEPGKGQES